MWDKFLDKVTGPAQQILQGAGRQVERVVEREAERAATRLAERAIAESSRRVVGVFSAIAPYESEPAPGPARSTGALAAGGLFALGEPDDDA